MGGETTDVKRVCLSDSPVCGVVQQEVKGEVPGETGVYFVDNHANGWCAPSKFVRVQDGNRKTQLGLAGGTIRLNGFDLTPEQQRCLERLKFQPIEGKGVPPASVGMDLNAVMSCLGP